MRVALDTNVLAYAENITHEDADVAKVLVARDIVRQVHHHMVVPIQVVTELGRVGIGRAKWTRAEAATRMRRWLAFPTVPISPDVVRLGVDLVEQRMVSVYDAMVIAAAATAGCSVLLTEDRQSAGSLAGVRLLNPFSAEASDELRALFQ